MTKAGLSQAAQDAFKMNYEQLVAGVTGLVRTAARWPARRRGRPLPACLLPARLPAAAPTFLNFRSLSMPFGVWFACAPPHSSAAGARRRH